MKAAPAPEKAKASGKKKFTMKRNLSVPALAALAVVAAASPLHAAARVCGDPADAAATTSRARW